MKYLRALGFILISFLLMGTMSSAKAVTLSTEQYSILNKAQFYGQMIGFPETIQAMVLQESSAGAGGRIGDDGKSIGVMQMKPSTARWVSEKYNWLPQYENDYEYAKALLDDNYALLIGSLYFKECYKEFRNWRRAVVCYNSGVRGASKMSTAKINNNKYLHNVKRRLKFVQRIRSVAMNKPRTKIATLAAQLEYWKDRCAKAEKYIEESPCDPDIYYDQAIAYSEWREAVSKEVTVV